MLGIRSESLSLREPHAICPFASGQFGGIFFIGRSANLINDLTASSLRIEVLKSRLQHRNVPISEICQTLALSPQEENLYALQINYYLCQFSRIVFRVECLYAVSNALKADFSIAEV